MFGRHKYFNLRSKKHNLYSIQVDIMHIQHVKSKQGNKSYEQILLRESYR